MMIANNNSKTKRMLVSLAILLYFFSIIVLNQINVPYLWIVSCVFCAVISLYSINWKLQLEKVIFIIIVFAFGVLNAYFVGTTSLRDQILLVFLFLISLLFENDNISENVFLISTLANAIVVLIRFYQVGFEGDIFISSSSNYVSVFLLYPLVVYYIIKERRHKSAPLFPVIIVWVLSLFARGRGGIISTSILLVGLLIIRYIKSSFKYRVLYLALVGVVCVFLFSNLDSFISLVNDSIVTDHFRSRGFESSRTYLWSDYLSKAFNSPKNLLLGVDISDTAAGVLYKGNPHNSFLNIHTHNGLIVLILVIVLLVKRIGLSIKTKNPVYFVCVVSLVVRAFTDSVFWPTYGTAVLFFVLFTSFSNERKARNVLLSI